MKIIVNLTKQLIAWPVSEIVLRLKILLTIFLHVQNIAKVGQMVLYTIHQ